MKKVNYLALGGLAASLMLFSGCQDEEFGYTKEDIKMQTSFEKHFGELKPDQIWDFSSYNLNRLGLEGGFNNVGKTRIAYNGVDDTPKMDASYALTYPQFYKVPTELRQWIDKNLREEVYNKKRGTTNFTLKMPTDRDIVIIPIYQGQAGLNFNLCIKSEEKDESEQPLFPTGYIWEKSAGIEWAEPGTEDWHGFGGDKSFYAHTVGREVHANPIRIKHDEVQGQFSLYLDILNLDNAWDGASGLPFSQTFSDQKHASSLDGQMVAVSLSNSPETFQAVSDALRAAFDDPNNPTDGKYTFDNFMLVGVEDSNLKRNIAGPEDPRLVGTDWDMNDMIFLVVGIKPNDIVYTKDEVIKKRYMIEDLGIGFGSYYDYDFNDIVIDVTQRKHTDENGVTTTTQTLSLKHLCGTIPWRVQVGDYISPILPGRNNHTAEWGYDPETGTEDALNTPYAEWIGHNGDQEVRGIINEIEITGWDPDANNITMTAWPAAAGEDVDQGASDWSTSQKENYLKEVDGIKYSFPENGTYPFIIACDQSQMWYPEHKTIPADAIVTWKKPGYETIITPGGGGGQGGEGGEGGEEEVEDDGYNSFVVPLPTEPDENGNYVVEFGEGEEIVFDSWTDDIVINPEYLQNIESGYKIITHFEKINEGEDFLMYMKVEAPWENIGGFKLTQDQTELEITVSPGNVDLLKTYGVALKGKNVKISKIEIIPGEWEDYYGEDLPWSGNKQLQWGDGLLLKPENFTNAQVGDQLRINASDNVKLSIPYPEGWDEFAWTADGKYEFTAEQLAAMKTFGLVITADNKSITHAELYRPLYCTLTLASTGTGSGTFEGAGRYESGTSVTFKAIASAGSRFVQWNDGVTTNPRTITLEESITYTAEFETVPLYTVTISTTVDPEDEGASGTVEGAGQYYEGDNYTIKAIPAENSVFVEWNDGNTDASRTFNNIQANASYTAKFALKTYTVTVNATPSVGGTVSGGGQYKHGKTAHLTAIPEDGYKFVSWNDGNINEERDVEVTADVTYTAKFVAEGAVTVYTGPKAMNNWGSADLALDATAVAAAIEDGKTTMTVSFSSCSTSYDMYLQTGWSNAIGTPAEVTVETTTASVSFLITDADMVKTQGLKVMIKANSNTTAGANITISDIVME